MEQFGQWVVTQLKSPTTHLAIGLVAGFVLYATKLVPVEYDAGIVAVFGALGIVIPERGEFPAPPK